MKIRKGDNVIVRSGRDKGKTGTVLRVYPVLNRVVVDGINIMKQAHKPSAKHPKGGIIAHPAPLPAGKVGLVHPEQASRASRIGYQMKDEGKVRVYRQANNKEVTS